MPERYQRYGLNANPFFHKLEPLKRLDDAGRFAHVASFQTILPAIDALVTDAAQAQKPAVVLICGGSGSGRTAVAEYALVKYRESRNLPPDRFFVQQPPVNHSSFDAARTCMIRLRSDIAKANINIGDLSKELSAAEIGKVPEPVLIEALRDLASRTAQTLAATHPHPAGFGVLLRRIPTLELFTTMLEVFSDAQTMVAVTASDGMEPQGDLTAYRHALDPLPPPDIPELIAKRWADFAPLTDPPTPFVSGGLRKAFTGVHPVERVLFLIGKVLDLRLATFPSGAAWPAAQDQLGFPEQYLVETIGVIQEEWRP
jgi:hypothetical protein